MKSESKLTAKDAIIDLVVSHISEEIAIKVPVSERGVLWYQLCVQIWHLHKDTWRPLVPIFF